MKILLANKFFFLNGGSETVFFQERDYLLRQGIPVIDFSMQHHENLPSAHSEYFVKNTDYYAENEKGIWKSFITAFDFIHNREAIKFLEMLIQKEKPNIAHLHNIYHQITPAIIPLLKKHGIKVIMTLHDYKLICPSYSMIDRESLICEKCAGKAFWNCAVNKCQSGSLSKSLLLAIEAYWHKRTGSYDRVDLFLAPSAFLADLISKHGVSSERIRVLHNGIDPSKVLCSKEDAGYAIYFGRISREKGIETLLKAHQRLNRQWPLKVVGRGPLFSEMAERYPQAEFTGYKTGDALNRLIEEASFVVVPSECNENCSMTVLEALAYGKPVIGSRTGGIPEQIEDGKTGFLFEMGNVAELTEKMSLLAGSAELRRKMGKAARKKLEKEYSLGEHCKKLFNFYTQLLSEN